MTLLNGASRIALADIEGKAKRALKAAFPGKRTMAGPVTGYDGVGFGVVFGPDRRHAVCMGSWAEYPDAIGQLKAWEQAN